jgi:hypothetical protein
MAGLLDEEDEDWVQRQMTRADRGLAGLQASAVDPNSPTYNPEAAGWGIAARLPLSMARGAYDAAKGAYNAYARGDVDQAGRDTAALIAGGGVAARAAPVVKRGLLDVGEAVPTARRGLLDETGRAALDIDEQLKRGLDLIDRIKVEQTDFADALHVPDQGPVTFRWGNESGGFAHIYAKHGDEAARQVPEVLLRGKWSEPTQSPRGRQRRHVTLDDKQVSLSLDLDGEPLTWVVTSFKKMGK